MPTLAVERVETLARHDLADLCEAAEAAIEAGGGFGWLRPPSRQLLETFWRGVTLVPERILFLARLDGVVAGSAQLVRPGRNNDSVKRFAALPSAVLCSGQSSPRSRSFSVWNISGATSIATTSVSPSTTRRSVAE